MLDAKLMLLILLLVVPYCAPSDYLILGFQLLSHVLKLSSNLWWYKLIHNVTNNSIQRHIVTYACIERVIRN